MNTTLQRIAILAAVTGLLGLARPALAQDCATNYTLIGPVGSEVSTTTNGYPLLTVFVDLSQCEALVSYDEVLTDCTGSTTNHLEQTVDVGEMFDPRLVCTQYVDDFGNLVTICTDAYFLTVVHSQQLFSIINYPEGSVVSTTNGLPLLTVAADTGQCTATVTFDVVRANSCFGPARTNEVTATRQVGTALFQDLVCNQYVDDFGNLITDCYYFYVTAVDTEPPVITCPANITSNAAPGSCSSVVTFAPVVSDNCDPSPTVLCAPASGSSFAAGTTPVTCTAIDASGNTNSCTFSVTVADATPPVITLKPALSIKENNHKYRTFSVTDFVASVGDTCSALTAANCVISQATSDEPDNAPGNSDGNTTNDIKIAAGCKSVQLMMERDEKKNGRVYKLTLKVKDAAGNIGQAVATMSIPLSNNGKPAIDSGVALTVNGCTP